MKKTKKYCLVKKGTLYFIEQALHCGNCSMMTSNFRQVAKTWEQFAALVVVQTELIDSMISPPPAAVDSVCLSDMVGGGTIETVCT